MVKFTQSNRTSLFTGEIIGSKFIRSQNMLKVICRQKVIKLGKMCAFLTKIIENSAFQYLRAMKFFLAETGTTKLQLQFQQSFLHYVRCHNATSWN